MTNSERQNLIYSIDESAAAIASEVGSAVVNSIFSRYGVSYAEEASDSDLPEIFSEMYACEADLK